MDIKILRVTEGDVFTEGKMYIEEIHSYYTVEDKDRYLEDGGKKVYGKTAIPRGLYPVTISFSNRFQKDLIEILDVPQFTGIRIHTGNSSEDTEGCIIVGSTNKSDDDDWVGGSRIAYEALHNLVQKKLDENEKVWLEVA